MSTGLLPGWIVPLLQLLGALVVLLGATVELSMRLLGRDGPIRAILNISKQHEQVREDIQCVDTKVERMDTRLETIEDIQIALARAANNDEDVDLGKIRRSHEKDDPSNDFLGSSGDD